jgi:hypothetical protein
LLVVVLTTSTVSSGSFGVKFRRRWAVVAQVRPDTLGLLVRFCRGVILRGLVET